MATTPTASQTPVDSKKWIQHFDLNYNVTKGLWKKETSENCVLAAAQKVVYLACAVFTAILETFQNLFLAVANGGISVANGVKSYFGNRTVESVNSQAEPATAEVRPAAKQIVNPTRTEKALAWARWFTVDPMRWTGKQLNTYVWQPIRHPQVTYQNVKAWYNTPASVKNLETASAAQATRVGA